MGTSRIKLNGTVFGKRSLGSIRRCKVMRVLVWPNITYSKDFRKDSYTEDILTNIRSINNLRDDTWWYVVSPDLSKHPEVAAEYKKLGNVTLLTLPFPTHPPTMRVHFDATAVIKLLDQKYDFDLVYTHLPEHTYQLRSVLQNTTHFDPVFVGYSHWFDFKEVVTWNMGAGWMNIMGVLEMDTCFLNTQSQLDQMISFAAQKYEPKTLDKLREILIPLHNNPFKADIIPAPKSICKTIVFNHRPWKYKNFDGFMEIMDALRKKRQDFRVWIPLLDKPNRDWVYTGENDTKEIYLDNLARCCAGYAPAQQYAGWSVAAMDGLKRGVPYVAFDADYYYELCPEFLWHSSVAEAVGHFSALLDSNKFRKSESKKQQNWILENRTAEKSAEQLNTILRASMERNRCMREDSKVLPKITKALKNGPLTKSELIGFLGWNRGIQWTPYRTRLVHAENAMCLDAVQSVPSYSLVPKSKRRRIKL